MITIRAAEERGHFNFGWLDTYHSFSFGDYYDPKHMGFRALRVINEDFVQPGKGFGMHPHRDMEIVTYILEGALQHRDSLGNGSIIRPGDSQRMTAGRGIMHSEFNPSQTESTHLLQIWIAPEQRGLDPGYEQKSPRDQQGKLRLLAARDGGDGAVSMHQDVRLYVGVVTSGEELQFDIAPGRHAWVQVARGALELNGKRLKQGDGAAVSEEQRLRIAATRDAEILLFDLA